MNNLLIVESENDRFFIEAVINNINVSINIDEPLCSIDEYECLSGIGNLKKRLVSLTRQVLKDNINKIGIIFDADAHGIEKRKVQIQEVINSTFDENTNIEFHIHIVNKDGYGELETLLRAIVSKDSITADCLDSLQDCLPVDKQLKSKDFDKLWIQFYQRYDCCNKKEQKQAGRKCNNEISLKGKNIYDYSKNIEELNQLKIFLTNLSNGN